MPRKRMRLILRRNFAIAKKLREKLHRQNPFTKLVASLNRHGSIKSDISERRKRNMNLEEFRKALSSDATEENAQLKRQLSAFRLNTMKSFQNSKMKTIHLKKVVGFYAIDALLLREVLLVYFVVSITPALICRGLRNRWLWLIN